VAVSFRILPDLGLVYVCYSGRAMVQEGYEAFGAYMMHPEFHPDQRQLVDLAAVTEVEQDFMRLFALQAGKAAVFMSGKAPTLLVYHAPTDLSLGMARVIQRSWEGLDGAIVRVVGEWTAAMDVLGLPHEALDLVHRRQA
jgi:hypothetical protein